jgi:hypothetical protein
MKKLLFVALIVIVGCSTGSKHDGKIVVTPEGEVFELVYNVGDTYYIHLVDVSKAKRIINLFESAPKNSVQQPLTETSDQ